MPYNDEDNNDYVDGKGFCCNDGSLEAAQARALVRTAKNNFQEGDAYEKMQFFPPLTIWVAVVTSPTLMARCCSILSMYHCMKPCYRHLKLGGFTIGEYRPI